jgi:hypothetical protein
LSKTPWPRWDGGRASIRTESRSPAPPQTPSSIKSRPLPRSRGELRRPAGTNHALAVVAGNTRSAAAHERLRLHLFARQETHRVGPPCAGIARDSCGTRVGTSSKSGRVPASRGNHLELVWMPRGEIVSGTRVNHWKLTGK